MNINDLSGIAITFVVLAIILGIGATVLTSVRNATSDTTVDAEYNITTEGLDALLELADWQVTLAIIIIASVVIGVIAFFWQRR